MQQPSQTYTQIMTLVRKTNAIGQINQNIYRLK